MPTKSNAQLPASTITTAEGQTRRVGMRSIPTLLYKLALLIGSRHFCVFKKTAKSYEIKKTTAKAVVFMARHTEKDIL